MSALIFGGMSSGLLLLIYFSERMGWVRGSSIGNETGFGVYLAGMLVLMLFATWFYGKKSPKFPRYFPTVRMLTNMAIIHYAIFMIGVSIIDEDLPDEFALLITLAIFFLPLMGLVFIAPLFRIFLTPKKPEDKRIASEDLLDEHLMNDD